MLSYPGGEGGGFRKGQMEMAEGVERRGQKVAGWAEKISMSREALELGGGRGRRTWAPSSGGPRGER